MKKTLLAGALLSSALVPGVVLAQAYGDTARVISATPLYDRVAEPRRECHDEQVTAYEERRGVRPASEARESGGVGAGTVIGAIVGGVIGHQFGGSSAGRDHGTAAGAIVGGLVGNQVDRDNDANATRDVVVERVPVTRNVQRCSEIADTRDVVVGYDVRYEYNGHELRARLPYDPGPQMPVNVDVRPPAPPAPIADPRMPRYRGTY
ncbi:MAG TPA: glycine zipper 2TM domain-containing protein [Usitatibacter sp.]